jgi:signal transduction histidine kinase
MTGGVAHALCSDVADVFSEERPPSRSRPGTVARAYAVFDAGLDGKRERFRGVVTARDIARNPDRTFEDILPRRASPTVTLDTPIDHALDLMRISESDALAVMDGSTGRFAGAITCASLARAMAHSARNPAWLAGIGHDLNNLLTIIAGGLSALQSSFDGDEHEARDLCEEMRLALLSTAAYGKHLTDFAAAAKRADMNEVVSRATAAVRLGVAQGAELTLTLMDELPPVAIGPVELFQVVFNLLLNARDATPAGGHVCIGTRVDMSHVTLTVADTGRGIAAEDMEHVFEAGFTRGKRSGLGLGLAAARACVVAAGGTLSLASEPNRGSTFTVRLPAAVG